MQTLWTVLVAILAGIVLGYMPAGQHVYATGGNLRAAAYAGINTGRVRFLALTFAGICAAMAGYRQRRLFSQLQSCRRAVSRA